MAYNTRKWKSNEKQGRPGTWRGREVDVGEAVSNYKFVCNKSEREAITV